MVSIPPIPAPKLTPTFVKSMLESSIPEFSIDWFAAIIPYWINGSILLISLESRKFAGSKFFKRPPIFTGLLSNPISTVVIPYWLA